MGISDVGSIARRVYLHKFGIVYNKIVESGKDAVESSTERPSLRASS